MPAPYHRIRLRRPWDVETAAAGPIWRRRFSRPTRIGPEERLWLVFEDCRAGGAVALNGQSLGSVAAGGTHRFAITPLLADRNEICWEAAAVTDAEGRADDPPAAVSLEIGLALPGEREGR